jgi:glycosyltransferase involved in cell wall biosynthesis
MLLLGTARTDARVWRSATALARAGADVTLLDIERDRTRPPREDVDGIHLWHLVMPDWFAPTRFKPWFLVKLARVLLWGVTCLLATPAAMYYANDDVALPACYVAAKLRRRPLIFDAHELPLVQTHVTRWRLLHAAATRVLSVLVRGCAGVITVSPPIVREIQRRYGGPEAIVVRNMPTYQAPMASDRLRERLGLGQGTRIALYQGNIDAQRGLELVVRAARWLAPDIAIVMMGRAHDGGRIQALIDAEGVGRSVRILPAVPYDELLNWTASADLGLVIFPAESSLSIQMCLPNKLFEYLMVGLPVLASPLEAVANVIATYGVGAIVDPEPRAIAQGISALLAEPATLARMREHAYAAARSELNWGIEQQALVGLYESLVGKRAAAEPIRQFV